MKQAQNKIVSASTQNNYASTEEAHMRKVTLYFVIGFSVFSEITSLAVFIITRNIEAMLFFQVPAWLFFYRILCYLFPTQEGQHPILAILRVLRKHP